MLRGTTPEARDPSHDSCEPGCTLAHAPTAVSRPGPRALRAAVDPSSRTQGLLGNGEGITGGPRLPRYVQCRSFASDAARGIRRRLVRRTLERLGLQAHRRANT